MKVTKAAKYKYELKTYEYNKNEIVQWKNDKKKNWRRKPNYMVWLRKQQRNVWIKLVTLRNYNVRYFET